MSYKRWTGEKLYSADLNAYLVDQSIPRFASAAARDAATTWSEGQFAYVTGTGLFVRTASAWKQLTTSGGALNAEDVQVAGASIGRGIVYCRRLGFNSGTDVTLATSSGGSTVVPIHSANLTLPAGRAYRFEVTSPVKTASTVPAYAEFIASAPGTVTRDNVTIEQTGANSWAQLSTVIPIAGAGTDTRTWSVGIRRGAGAEVVVAVSTIAYVTFTIEDVGPASIVVNT